MAGGWWLMGGWRRRAPTCTRAMAKSICSTMSISSSIRPTNRSVASSSIAAPSRHGWSVAGWWVAGGGRRVAGGGRRAAGADGEIVGVPKGGPRLTFVPSCSASRISPARFTRSTTPSFMTASKNSFFSLLIGAGGSELVPSPSAVCAMLHLRSAAHAAGSTPSGAEAMVDDQYGRAASARQEFDWLSFFLSFFRRAGARAGGAPRRWRNAAIDGRRRLANTPPRRGFAAVGKLRPTVFVRGRRHFLAGFDRARNVPRAPHSTREPAFTHAFTVHIRMALLTIVTPPPGAAYCREPGATPPATCNSATVTPESPPPAERASTRRRRRQCDPDLT